MDSIKEDITSRPSFFTILLQDSVDYLPLPRDFAEKHLQESISKKQTLVLEPNKESGLKWRVRCLKIEDRYYLMDGWLNFMKENRLEIGDFLVFWLLSSSNFLICIYAPNGCRKIPASFSDEDGDKSLKKKKLMVKEEICDQNEDGDLSENLPPNSMRKVIKKSHIYKMPMKKNFLKSVGINGYGSVWLKNDDGKLWEAKVRKYEDEKMTYIGWFDFREDNKMEIGDACEFNHVQDNLIHVHVLKKHQLQ